MTTPYTTVLSEGFDGADGSAWPPGEWTASSRAGLPSPTFSIQSGVARIAPGAVGTQASQRILHASRWKDTNLGYMELAVTLSLPSYSTAQSAQPGVLFCWDGNVDSPSGYLLTPAKTGGALELYRLTAGAFTKRVSRTVSLSGPTRVRLRFAPGPFTFNIAFKSWSASTAEPFTATGSGSWTTITDSTYSGGRLALVSYYDSQTGGTNVLDANWVGFDDLTVQRIGQGNPGLADGAPAVALLTSGSSTTDTTSYTTASISPTAGPEKVWLAYVATAGNGTVGGRTLSGCGLTWTALTASSHTAGARRFELYRGVGTPTTGVLTYAGPNMTAACWAVLEVSGASSGGVDTLPFSNLTPIMGTGTAVSAGSTSATVTVDTAVVGDMAFGTFITAVAGPISNSSDVITPAGIVTKLVEVQGGSTPTTNLCVAYQNGYASALSQTFNWTGSASLSWAASAVVVQPSVRYAPQDGASVSFGVGG